MSARLTCLHGHPWEPDPGSTEPPNVCPVCAAPFEAEVLDGSHILVAAPHSRPDLRQRLADDPAATIAAGDAPAQNDNEDDLTIGTEAAVASPLRTAVPGYEILAELGRGGMGVVYKARHIGLQRLVALKMILAGVHVGPKELFRFRSEAAAVAALQHPGIVQIYEVGEYEGRPYFSLEYVEGGSLAQHLQGAPLPPLWSAQLLETLARTVHYAHQRGIVHRDLKPANVLIAAIDDRPSAIGQKPPPGDPGRPTVESRLPIAVKITDFGLAKQLQTGAGMTQSGTVLGTPSYMAPEQALGKNREVGPAADIYALGAILYEMLTGRPPFRAETSLDTMLQVASEEPTPLSRLVPRLPRDLQTICLKCLHKEPWKRYASSDDLADDLRRFLTHEPIHARPVSTLERAYKWARRRPSLAALLLFALATLVGTFGLIVAEWRQEAEQLARLKEAQNQTASALARAEANLYCNRIALAEREWLANNLARARHLLQECPPGQRQWEWHYLNRLCHAELLTLRGHDGAVYNVTFSPDGRHIATVGADQGVRFWDPLTGKLIATQKDTAPRDRSGVLGYGSNSQRIYFAALGQSLKVWDLVSGKELASHPWPGGTATVVALGPERQRLGLGGSDGSVRVWDIAQEKEVLHLHGHSKPVHCVAFSPGGRLLASGAKDGSIKVWDANNGKELHTLTGHVQQVNALAFSPNGQRLASASADGTVRVWESWTGRLLHTFHGHVGHVLCVAFSPSGSYIASGGRDRSVKVWDTRTGDEAYTIRGHTHQVLAVAYSPNGRLLATAGEDHLVRLWDATTGQEARTHRAMLLATALAYSRDGRLLATADDGVKIWDPATGRKVQTFGSQELIEAVAFAPDGKRVATAGKRGLKVWDVDTGMPVFTLRGPSSRERGVSYSSDGKFIASAGADGVVRLWDAGRGDLVRELKGHLGTVNDVEFSPDGSRLATAGGDHTVRIWDTASGKEVAVLGGHTGPVQKVAFSPKGDTLASGATNRTSQDAEGVDEGELKIWDLANGEERATLWGHTGAITDVAFSPDGQRLASASEDQTIKMWDVALGQEVLTLRGRNGWVQALAFSPDGRLLASVSTDQNLRFWNATPLQ